MTYKSSQHRNKIRFNHKRKRYFHKLNKDAADAREIFTAKRKFADSNRGLVSDDINTEFHIELGISAIENILQFNLIKFQ